MALYDDDEEFRSLVRRVEEKVRLRIDETQCKSQCAICGARCGGRSIHFPFMACQCPEHGEYIPI